MPEFEIIADYLDGRKESQVIAAATWLDAWRLAGEDGSGEDTARISVRSLGDVVDVEIATAACRYRLRSRSSEGPISDEIAVEVDIAFAQAPTQRLSVRQGDRAEAVQDDRQRRALPTTGQNPRVATQDYEISGHSQQSAKPEKKSRLQSTTEDNPVQVEQPTERVSTFGLGRKGDAISHETRTHAPATDARELPQLFTPMAEFGGGPTVGTSGGRERGAIVSWAIETVWRQVPSRLVLGLVILGRDVTVTHARGEGARLLQGARGRLDEWPAAVVLHKPSRMRFGGDAVTLWFRGSDDTRQPVELKSAIWTPLDAIKDSGRDDARSLRTVVMAIDAPRATGFTEGEMSAFGYLAQMVAARLA